MSSTNFSNGSIAIAICDRCGCKYRYTELRADIAKPGLRVCKTCVDLNHPIKTFKPRPDNFTLKYPRPDEPLFNVYVVVEEERGPIQAYTPEMKELATGDTPIAATGYTENSGLNQYLPPSIRKKYGIKK